MLDAFLVEVLAPMCDQFFGQIVGFVDKQDELFITFSNFFDVLLQVCTVEEVWISCIDDLKKHVTFFNDTPKLAPDVQIFLKWSNSQSHVVLLYRRDISSPLEESLVFLRLDLVG